MHWSLTRTAAPVVPLLTLEEARQHLRIDAFGDPLAHPDDALIQQFVQAATDEIDGANGWLGRALITQEWRLDMAWFPCRRILLPLPTLQDVIEVAYYDGDGARQVADSSIYRVVKSDSDAGYIELVSGQRWQDVER